MKISRDLAYSILFRDVDIIPKDTGAIFFNINDLLGTDTRISILPSAVIKGCLKHQINSPSPNERVTAARSNKEHWRGDSKIDSAK